MFSMRKRPKLNAQLKSVPRGRRPRRIRRTSRRRRRRKRKTRTPEERRRHLRASKSALSIPLFDHGPGNRYDSDDDTPMSSASTAVPSDEDFLTSWDEWGDIEGGGVELPKAEWTDGNYIDFKNGKVIAVAALSRGSCHRGDTYGAAEPPRGSRKPVVSVDAVPSLVNDVLSES